METTTITPAISSAEVPRAIGEIRAYLGLNTTELAGALGVTRQAIYDWVNGGTVKAANRCKVAALLEIAGQWRSLGGEPMGPAVLELPEYGKLVSLLKEVPLDRDAVQRVLEGIHAKMEEAKATALPSARDLAERYGIKPKSESEYRKTVRMVSRHMRGRI